MTDISNPVRRRTRLPIGLQPVISRLFVLFLASWIPLESSADTHIYAGATGTNQGAPLLFTTAHLFDPASGYKLPMVLRTNGNNVGYYRGDSLTFTALSATDIGTGQLLGRALLGSRLAVQMVAVEGPPGGSVSFWNGDGENPGRTITFSLPVGTAQATNGFVISENDGSPGSDPYGHIHGREFTTTLPGLYQVGFRLVDISTNGSGGGPLHSPSDILPILFQAGPTIEMLQPATNGIRVLFRSAPGVTNDLEASDDLLVPSWQRVAGGLRGNGTLQYLTDPRPLTGSRMYRLRLLNIPP